MLRQLRDGLHQRGIFRGERAVIVKQRIDDVRTGDDQQKSDGQHGQPEIKPPAPRTAADQLIKNLAERGENDHAQELFFGPIPKPGGPAFDRLVIEKRQGVPIDADRQFQEIDQYEQRWNENEALQPAFLRAALGEIANAADCAELQKEK
jgi:hypothetical protein